ncbi:hypothetical protein [Klebsiella variicola]|uniref:hypothetical protein n=1 Tax=Klebsiella variicola TaxID=244366 RepID=UPI001D17CFB6
MSTANNKPAESVSLNAFKQPRAFYLIFSIELWERFGYYGLQGIMAVYLVKQLGMSKRIPLLCSPPLARWSMSGCYWRLAGR